MHFKSSMTENQCESSQRFNRAPIQINSKILTKTNASNFASVKEQAVVTDTHCKVLVKVNQIFKVLNLLHPQFENTIHIKPNYFLETFLNGVQFMGVNGSPYSCKKTSRFPYSRFQFRQNRQDGNTFELTSNFSGSKYNLTVNGQNIFTISFTVSCSLNSCRQFQLFGLGPGVSYSSLEGSQSGQDLEELFTKGRNISKIIKLRHLSPQMNPFNGELVLEFARREVIASVQNAVIVDKDNNIRAQMFKIDSKDNLFDIHFLNSVPLEWMFAFALASLDFKLALQ